jgi:hypothetical protein
MATEPQVIQQTQTTIPDYAQPYVENMLGQAQGSIFKYKLDSNGQPLLDSAGKPQVVGVKEYPTYNFARFANADVLSQQAYNTLQNMGLGAEAGNSLQNAYNMAAQAGQSKYNPSVYSNQYKTPNAYVPNQFNYQAVSPQAAQFFQMQQPTNVNGATASAAQLGNTPVAFAQFGQAANLGAAPTNYSGKQLQYTPTPITPNTVSALKAGQVTAPTLNQLQMSAAGDVGTNSFLQPGSAAAYMSPYMQNVVDIQQREAQRQADIAATKRGAQFAQAGAFGGSRQAIENAEAARNLATQKGDIQAQGLQAAYQSGQGQFNTEQQAALQAALANQGVQQQAGVQNLSALLQTQGLGAQTGLTAQQLNQQAGMQALLANQQTGLQASQFNQQQEYNTALQNAQLAQQQQLANQGLVGQYGIQQATMEQQMAAANLANRQQATLANQALLGQYGLQQGQYTQAANLQNAQMQQQANLANQQAGLTTGQQNLAANLGVQQLYNQQGLQAALANQQAGMTTQQQQEAANQYGYNQQMAALANQAQYGLGANQLQEQANQYGAGFGLQALQAGMQGMQNYGNLSGLYNQQQQNIANAQNLMGTQAQNYVQQQLTQNYNDFINQRDYPIQQIGQFSNILRGLPLSQTSTAQYQQSPSLASQAAGFGTAALGATNLFKAATGAKGGIIHKPRGLSALAISQIG